MKVEVTHEVVPVIKISGEVDFFDTPELQKSIDELISQGNKYLVFDFSNADYIDSGGIEVLISTLKKLTKIGRLGFISNNNDIIRLLELVGVSRFTTFSLFPSKTKALEDFERIAGNECR